MIMILTYISSSFHYLYVDDIIVMRLWLSLNKVNFFLNVHFYTKRNILINCSHELAILGFGDNFLRDFSLNCAIWNAF